MTTAIGFESTIDGVTLKRFVIFDSAWEEVHAMQATPTTHPIEDNTQLSDHVHISPVKVSLQVRVVQSPLRNYSIFGFEAAFHTEIGAVPTLREQRQITTYSRKQRSQVGLSGGNAPFFRTPLSSGLATPVVATAATYESVPETIAFFSTGARNSSRVQTVYEALKDVVLNGRQVELVTDLQTYPKMIITAMSVPKEATDGLTFSMQLETVKYAGTTGVAKVEVKVLESRAKEKKVAAIGTDDVIGPDGVDDGQKQSVFHNLSSTAASGAADGVIAADEKLQSVGESFNQMGDET